MNREKLQAAINAESDKLSARDSDAICEAFGAYLETDAGEAGFTCRAKGGMTRTRSMVASAAGMDAFRAGYLAGRDAAIRSLGLASDRATIGAAARLLSALAEHPLDRIAEEPERRKRIGRAAVELARLLADEWFGEVLR